MRALTRREILGTAAGALAAAAAPGFANPLQRNVQRPGKPLVLGHRGACALRPEHTLASYAKAIADGADYIEPDLVPTKDGHLVARHENNIAETTDIAAHPEFAARKATKTIDGQQVTGWFTEDFTLAELKTLRAKERLGPLRPESASYDGQFQIVTLEEIADFLGAEAAARARTIGLIPEIKHSTYFASLGMPTEPRFLATIRASRILRATPLIVQSFEVANLKALRAQIADLPNIELMQLTEGNVAPADRAAAGDKRPWSTRLDPAGLTEVATYADWLSPYRQDLIPQGAEGKLAQPTGLIAAAHAAGLKVSTWTFRPENHFLATDFRDGAGDAARNSSGSMSEIRTFLKAGIDAFFTDDPALGRAAVDGA